MAQPVKTKRVACCKCGEDRAECPDCKEGYKQMALSGKTPHFKNKQLSLRNLSLYQHFFLVCVCVVFVIALSSMFCFTLTYPNISLSKLTLTIRVTTNPEFIIVDRSSVESVGKTPVCGCGTVEQDTCPVCNKGFMDLLSAGLEPLWKETYYDPGWCG